MSALKTITSGVGPDQLRLPNGRARSLGRLRYLSAAILALPAMAGARALPPMAAAYPCHDSVIFLGFAPNAVGSASGRALNHASNAASCRDAQAPTATASSSDAINGEDATATARRRTNDERPRIFVAYSLSDASRVTAAREAAALEQASTEASLLRAAARPVVSVAGAAVSDSASLSAADASPRKDPALTAKRRLAADRPRTVGAKRAIRLPAVTAPKELNAANKALAQAAPERTAKRPAVVAAKRLTVARKASSAAPASVACNSCTDGAANDLNGTATLTQPTLASDAYVVAYQEHSARRGPGGPSADAAFGEVDAAPQQLMMPERTPEPQAAAPLHSYRYIPSQKMAQDVPRPPAQQELIQLNQDGNYAVLAKKGRTLLKNEKLDDELRFIIANALAWTGKLHPAETLYGTLLKGPMALDAKVALANITRWRGKDYLAVPMYREVLAVDPTHEEAARGLQLSEDAMRPRTRLSLNRTHDSDQVKTSTVTLDHRWQTHEGFRTWDVELNRMNASSPFASGRQATVVVRHQELDRPMEPAVELGIGDRLYGRITIRPTPLPIHVTVGKVNWAQMSLNPVALKKRLSAVDVGVNATFDGRFGNVSIAADNYHVSDSNNVQTGTVRFSPAFHLPLHIRPVVGLEYRKADFNTISYWSPNAGYGTGYVGLEGDWSGKNDRWTVSASAQRGWGFYGEAKPSWGGSVSGRYKISRDWTLGASVWAIINSRNDKPYRANSAIVFLERKW